MHLRLLCVPGKRPNRRSAKEREEIASYHLPPPRPRTALQAERMIPHQTTAIVFLALMSPRGQTRKSDCTIAMSASLIGRLGSSAFRPSTTTVATSLAGSCFSSESAPRPFHHGIRGRGGTIFRAALPSIERQVQADIRTHLIHRPARDIFPPLGGTRVFSYRV